ncbi:MAG: hypothetical protein E7561_05065 [Ruminococcaceae bacterium]|nr:hypothetical protein [Oscillospiraceae bacterium]
MTVYADVLLLINLIVDYFLLSLTGRLLKNKISLLRMILGSSVGAASSLYIFLPKTSILLEFMIKLGVSAVMCLITFGFQNLKYYLKCFAVLSAVTMGYGGGMMAVWYIFKPNGMIINNSVVYFNVSPVFLIMFSAVAYLITAVVRVITENNCVFCEKCNIEVVADNVSTQLNAIVDTGNSVEDVFRTSEIIVVDESVAYSLFDGYPTNEKLKRRYRALPISTVSGTTLLDGYRCDKAYVNCGKKRKVLKGPILAVSKAEIKDGYNAIINPKILE